MADKIVRCDVCEQSFTTDQTEEEQIALYEKETGQTFPEGEEAASVCEECWDKAATLGLVELLKTS